MSTPNAAPSVPVKHATPSQTAVTPRSAPSPALYRSHPAAQVARTPQPNGVPKGGTPMVPSLSQASAGSIGVKLEGVSPATFGIGSIGSVGNTSGLLNFASPNAMAAIEGMVMGTPGMGMTVADVAPGKRDEDQERRRKIQGILGKLVGTPGTARRIGMGRISDEGVRRVGRWAGFDVEIEKKYQAKEHEGQRPIVIAGRNAVLIDVAFANDKVSKAEVTFTSEDEDVASLQAGAAEVLRNDLTPTPGVAAINTSLNQFASNLEALARLDRLSSPTVNCVEAVTGIYTSLKRLYEHEFRELTEKDGPEEVTGRSQRTAKRVMREKSGRPGMHVHGRVGLSLNYWSEKKTSKPVPEASPKSSKAFSESDQQGTDTDKIYSLEITVEANTIGTIPPIRISKGWIGKDIVKSADTMEDAPDAAQLYTGLDWREPPQLLAAPKDPDAVNNDDFNTSSTEALPDVRFVARLHPPIVMPYTIATQILQLTGLPSTPPVDQSSSYEALLLGLTTTGINPATSIRRQTFLPRPDVEQDITQHISLYVPKPEMACTLSSLPFSHPMHLVLALPLLRQWAHLGHILQTALVVPADLPKPLSAPTQDETGQARKRIALDALLASTPAPAAAERQLDMSLSTGGAGRDPALTLFVPSDEALGPLCVRVGLDGKTSVSSRGVEHAVLVRGLEAVEDLGVWIEWARSRGWKVVAGGEDETMGDVGDEGAKE